MCAVLAPPSWQPLRPSWSSLSLLPRRDMCLTLCVSQGCSSNYFLDESEDQWLIPISVVVETWGQIVGSKGNWLAGLNFLAWLNTPGKDLLIIGHDGEIGEERQAIEGLRIDCVDAMILTLASRIFQQCQLETPLRIATSDLRDFLRLGAQGIPFHLYDWREI